MNAKIKKFLHVLKAELEELKEDLETFGELYRQREEKGEITPYVFRENMNLIANEISGIQEIVDSVDDLVSTPYTKLDDFIGDLAEKVKRKLKESGYADAAFELVKRKLAKVSKYILDET